MLFLGLTDGPNEIRQHPVGRGFKAWIGFSNGETGKKIGLKFYDRGRALNPSQGISERNLLRAHRGCQTPVLPPRLAQEFIGLALTSRRANLVCRQPSNTFPPDLGQLDRLSHQHAEEHRGFHRGIPAVDIMAGIGFGDSKLLRLAERLLAERCRPENAGGGEKLLMVEDFMAHRIDVGSEAFGGHDTGVEVAVSALRLTERNLDVQAQSLH